METTQSAAGNRKDDCNGDEAGAREETYPPKHDTDSVEETNDATSVAPVDMVTDPSNISDVADNDKEKEYSDARKIPEIHYRQGVVKVNDREVNLHEDSDSDRSICGNDSDGSSPLRAVNLSDEDKRRKEEKKAKREQLDFTSITQRSRKRLEWATMMLQDNLPAEGWACEKQDCSRPFCCAYRKFSIAKAEFEKCKAAVEDAPSVSDDQSTTQNTTSPTQVDVEQQQEELERRKQDLQKSQLELENILAEKDADQRLVDLYRKTVEDKKALLDQARETLKDKKALLKKDKALLNQARETLKDKKVLLKQNKVLLEKNKVILKQASDLVIMEAHHLCYSHKEVKELLIQAKSMGNKSDYVTLQTNRSMLEAKVKAEDRRQPHMKEKGSPSQLYNTLSNPELISTDEELAGLTEDKLNELNQFYVFLDKMFGKSKPSQHPYDSEAFKEDINVTCNKIVNWTSRSKRVPDVTRPNTNAEEVYAVQPILFALVFKISCIIGVASHVTREQYLQQCREKTKRWMDGLVSSPVQHHLAMAGGSVPGKSIEIKPLSREGTKFSKLVETGINQVYGHNFQGLYEGYFHFCNSLGCDGKTSGIVLTMASAIRLDAELIDVGTPNVRLKQHCSMNAPLFSKATTKHLFMEKEESLSESDLEFISTVDKAGCSKMQRGFKVLVCFLMKDNTRSTPLIEGIAQGSQAYSVKEYLGAGAFSTVYKGSVKSQEATPSSAEKSCILKVAKPYRESNLANELAALKVLKHPSIPKLHEKELIELKISLRCEYAKIKCLVLDLPVGTPARIFCQGDEELIWCLWENIMSALQHVHAENWFHMDVQPSNIIMVREAEGLRAILIDWGSSMSGSERLTGHRGTLPFSHPDLLMTEEDKTFCSTYPRSEFDTFALATTVCCLLNNGTLPWDGFNQTHVTTAMLDNRKKQTSKLIKQSTLEKNQKKVLRGFLSVPKEDDKVAGGDGLPMSQQPDLKRSQGLHVPTRKRGMDDSATQQATKRHRKK